MFLLFSTLFLACGPHQDDQDREFFLVARGFRDPLPESNAFPLPDPAPFVAWSYEIKDDELVVLYSVANVSDQDIWIFDGLVNREDPTLVERKTMQVGSGMGHRSVRLFLGFSGNMGCFPSPRGMEARLIPAYTRHTEARRIPLPLWPYDPAYDAQSITDRVEQLELAIGWTVDGPGMLDLRVDAAERPRVDPFLGPYRQRWLYGAPIRLTEAEIEAINP